MRMLDFRTSLRSLRRAPAFTVPALLTLALGIGACVAIWSAIHRVFLESLPYSEPGQLYTVREIENATNDMYVAGATFMEWRDRTPSLVGAAIFQARTGVLKLPAGPIEMRTTSVSGDFFATLGARPQLGHLLDRTDELSKEGRGIVLSAETWRKHFQGDQAILGRAVTLNGEPCTVVGVLSDTFFWPQNLERAEIFTLFRPERFIPSGGHGNHSWRGIIRLKPGVPAPQAVLDLSARVAAIKAEGGNGSNWGVRLKPLREDDLFRGEGAKTLFFLLASAGVLLFIALLNTAGLLLARGLARIRGAALQRALGASRLDLLGHHLAEGLLLGLGACLLGSLFARLSLDTLGQWIQASSPTPLLSQGWHLDGTTLAVALGLSLVSSLVLAMFPMAQLREGNLQRALGEGGRGGITRASLRLRRLLIVVQVALSTTLLATCGFFLRSYLLLRAQPVGFQAQGQVVFEVQAPRKQAFEQNHLLWEELQRRFAALPGVRRAASGGTVPFSGSAMGVGTLTEEDGLPDQSSKPMPFTGIIPDIRPGYFEALGVPLRAGRFPAVTDQPGRPLVCWVNETYARRFWPGASPLDRGIRVTTSSKLVPENAVFHVAGVVPDTRTQGYESVPEPMVYLAEAQFGSGGQYFILETSQGVNALRPPIQAIVRELLPDNPPPKVQRLEDLLDANVKDRSSFLAILAALAVVSTFLSAVGLASLQAYQVVQRRREIAIRMALGAKTRDVLHRFASQGLGPALIGILVGLAISAFLHRALSRSLYGLPGLPLMDMAGILLLLAVVSLAASLLPALQATRLDPSCALRDE